jgi:hypothetical protein
MSSRYFVVKDGELLEDTGDTFGGPPNQFKYPKGAYCIRYLDRKWRGTRGVYGKMRRAGWDCENLPPEIKISTSIMWINKT